MKALYYFKRAVSLPPHIVLKKVIQKLQKRAEAKRKRAKDENNPTYEINYSYAYLNRRVEKVDLAPIPRKAIQAVNSHTIHHEFNLLGSGWTEVFHGMECKGLEDNVYPIGQKGPINAQNAQESERIQRIIYEPYQLIDWHIDFKSGYRWKEDSWSEDIQYGNNLGADVKVPWELARMQHLPQLAWGYALEADETYLLEFRNQILDFISQNPPRYGVNWVCTMDVGIRIANWLLSYDIFIANGAKFDEEFEAVFIRSVYEHGKHIFTHLEWDPHLRSNHYLANIAGLLFVSAYLQTDPEVLTWLNFSISELQKEVLLQFHPDGSNFEASTSYHRLSTEMVVYATALALQVGADFSETYLKRVEKMADFIRDITKPDGEIVQFGDNDSGRFIRAFPEENGLDHRYLIQPIRNLKNLTQVLGDQLETANESISPIMKYPDFGLYIQRNKTWYLALRAGSIGQKGNGGHAHNDQLSFELAINGTSFIVDPGTYVYTPLPESRRHFRSTQMHNTLVVNEKEQMVDEGLFKMSDRARGKILQFKEQAITGEHRGFGATHRRTLKLGDKCLVGIDVCDQEEKTINFHIAPGWKIQSIDMRKVICEKRGLVVELSTNSGSWDHQESQYSRTYGVKEAGLNLSLISKLKTSEWQIQAL